MTKTPNVIKKSPIIFPQVKVSLSNKTPTTKTKAGDKLIKGYALVISILLMAAIQNKEAMKAEANPEKM